MRWIGLFSLIAGSASAVGFGLAAGVIGLWTTIQGPFQPEWDNSWHEFIPAALAYLTWMAATAVGLITAWRMARRHATTSDGG